MQGRLVPPEAGSIQAFPAMRWRDEFPRAAEAGLAAIEWIYDVYGEGRNPLENDDGLEEILALSAEHGVRVASVCADWFIPNALGRAGDPERDARIERLAWLLGRSARLGVDRLVVPFLDDSALLDRSDEEAALDALRRVIDVVEESGIRLHLETSLAPRALRAFLARIEHELVEVTYDIGNSAALGYRLQDELDAYGARIGSVHVKDRLLGGGSVPLGEGDADLQCVFDGLARLGYAGDIVLQVARDRPGDEVAWMIGNRLAVESLIAAEAR